MGAETAFVEVEACAIDVGFDGLAPRPWTLGLWILDPWSLATGPWIVEPGPMELGLSIFSIFFDHTKT